MSREPQTQILKAHCAACKKDISIKLLVNVPVKVATAWMRALHCPLCGAGHKRISV
jgi:hypothetical protein